VLSLAWNFVAAIHLDESMPLMMDEKRNVE